MLSPLWSTTYNTVYIRFYIYRLIQTDTGTYKANFRAGGSESQQWLHTAVCAAVAVLRNNIHTRIIPSLVEERKG